MKLILTSLFVCMLINNSRTFSVTTSVFESSIKNRCFNRSALNNEELILGQYEPVGLSIENLISLLEKIELKNPTWKPKDVVKAVLERFHMDGIHWNGEENIQSNLEYTHSLVTNVILTAKSQPDPVSQALEASLTEDEKCTLFFTLSHSVNQTALETEDELNTYVQKEHNFAKAPARDMGTDIPLPERKSTTPKAVQSGFADDDDDHEGDRISKHPRMVKRSPRYMKKTRLTKTPREYGVASFLSSPNSAIATNRVLLGLYVALAEIRELKMSEVLKILQKPVPEHLDDETVDPSLAVTLADLYAIDTNQGMQADTIIFGADGKWNSTVCHTKYMLVSNGTWGTMAEFRGGLDGYRISLLANSLIANFRKLKASQILRLYYSRYGLNSDTGVCTRKSSIQTTLKDDLKSEAFKYLLMWNSIAYNSQYSPEKLKGYLESIEEQFMQTLDKSALKSDAENQFCNNPTANDIKAQPCEGEANAFFLLDANRKCDPTGDCQQAVLVRGLSKHLTLGDGIASTSVFTNAKPMEENKFDGIVPPLYTLVYDSTSNECGACKANHLVNHRSALITERAELFESIGKYIKEFDQTNQTTRPANVFFWFDYGTVKPIPNERLEKLKYEQTLREIRYVRRDVNFFGITTNVSNINDLVTEVDNVISIEPNEVNTEIRVKRINDLVCQTPSTFQYPQCKSKPSNNFVHKGYITVGYKQYWSMLPTYFLKSYEIQMKFKAKSKIQVCFSRSPHPEMDQQKFCKEPDGKNEILFSISNPCLGKTMAKCEPFYFTISAFEVYREICNEPACKNINQIEWEFAHTGISCNRSTALSLSFVFLFMTFVITMYQSFF